MLLDLCHCRSLHWIDHQHPRYEVPRSLREVRRQLVEATSDLSEEVGDRLVVKGEGACGLKPKTTNPRHSKIRKRDRGGTRHILQNMKTRIPRTAQQGIEDHAAAPDVHLRPGVEVSGDDLRGGIVGRPA